jgi:hypothetical protein
VPKQATRRKYIGSGATVYEYDHGTAAHWVAMARTALESVLPRGHAILRQFEGILPANGDPGAEFTFEKLHGTFRAARKMLLDGQLSSLASGIRADTESELLGQADALIASGYVVAATVLAGGALETHLLGLCVTHSLTWAGDGSISKYDAVIAQARNAGHAVIYSATDSKNVTAWGGMRNDAAHSPTTFSHSREVVSLMSRGIRDFITRTG